MITYLHSKILDMDLKLDNETGITTVKDLKRYGQKGYVKYSSEEVNILNELGGITPDIHLVKNVFNGEIVREVKGE